MLAKKKRISVFVKLSFSGQSIGDVVIQKFIETLIVVDKSVKDRFDNESEARRYVKVLFSLVS